VDKIAIGDNYNPSTGQYSNVARGLLGRAGQVGATALGGPLAGQITKNLANNWVDTGNPLNFSSNDSRIGQLIQAFSQNGQSPQIGPVTRAQFSPGSLSVTNLPGVSSMAPRLNPGVAQGQPNLGTGRGLFGGGSGNFGAPVARGYGQAAGSFTPQGAGVIQIAGQGFSGADAARGFGIGAGSGGSAGSIALADAIAANKRMRD
jgi:hypothetical protein